MHEMFDPEVLKHNLEELEQTLNQMIEADAEYAGEADELKDSIVRLKAALKPVETDEQFEKIFPSIQDDLFYVLKCVQEMGFNDGEGEFDEDEIDDEEMDEYEEEKTELDDEDSNELDELFELELSEEINSFIITKSVEEFMQSSHYLKLTKEQKELSYPLLNQFARHMGLMCDASNPFNWTLESLEIVCMEDLTESFYCREDLIKEVPNVLIAYLEYASDEGLLTHGKKYIESVKENQEKLIGALSDDNNWHPAKHFIMSMIEIDADIPTMLRMKEEFMADEEETF